jgi:hypothetical protein
VFGAPVGVPFAVPLLGALDGVCDQVAGVGVEVAERPEDGGVGVVGGQPDGLAAVGAVAADRSSTAVPALRAPRY